MDYDNNDAQDQNLHLAGEESSKVSPVLRPYALPKFDFDDSLPGHLRFDNLVENEVFLGITNQEDNQWIEEYSRGTSAIIQFSSSAEGSRRKNVWSEATSSESVEMLLKSVGQEEKVVEETIIEELDACDEPRSLTNVMDPNLKQCDQKDAMASDEFQESFVGSRVGSDCEHARFTSQSQETQISGGELDSVVIGEKYSLSVSEKKVDKICDDVNQKEASNITNEAFNNELPDPCVSKIECANISISQNVDASIEGLKCQENPLEVPERCIEKASGLSKNFSSREAEHIIKSKEDSMDNLTNSGTIVETCTLSEQKPSVVSYVESMVKPSVEVGIPVDEEPTGSLPTGNRDMQIVEGNNRSEMSEGSDVNNVGTSSRSACSSAEFSADEVSNKDVVAQDNAPKVHTGDSNDEDRSLPAKLSGLVQVGDESRSTESDAIPMDQDVTFNDRGNARLPLDSGDTDMEVVGATDCQKNNEPSLNAEGSESIAAMESSKISSPDTLDGMHVPSRSVATADIVTEDQPKSPILGVSLLSDDNEEKAVGFSSEGSLQKGTPKAESKLGCALDGPLSVVGKGAVSDHAEEVVHGMSGQCDSPVENCNASPSEQATEDNPGGLECSKTLETNPRPCDSLVEGGNDAEARDLPDPKGSMTGQDRVEPLNLAVNISDEQQVSVDVAGPSERDANRITHNLNNSNLPDLNNSISTFQQSFTDNQQVQLRAQILVYGSILAGMPPEEPHMIAAFGQSDGGRSAWETAWHTYVERVHGHKPQANNPDTPMRSRSVLKDVGNKDADQGIKIGSSQSEILSPPTTGPTNTGTSSPVIGSMIPISSPLWNISTSCDSFPSSAMPRNTLFDYRQALSPLQMQNFVGHNPSLPGQRVASSPISAFSACFSAFPITESVTTVKESSAPGVSTNFLDHSASPSALSGPINATVSSSHPSSDSKTRKRKKDVTAEENLSKIEESKLQAEDAARHAADAISHCQCVWSQLQTQKSSGLVSDDEAKLASSAVSIAAAASVAKVAAAAAKIASNVAEQARLVAEEVFLSSRTENVDQSNMVSLANVVDGNDAPNSIISAAREAARRRIEATSAAVKHAENLDAIIKAAELAAEAVSQAGKIVAMGNPMALRELIEAGPEGYWKTDQLSNQLGYSDKKNLELTPKGKEIQTSKRGLSPQEDSGNLAENQLVIDDENDKTTASARKDPDLAKPVGLNSESEPGPVHISVDQDMPESTSGSWKENDIKEGCLVEVYKDDNKHKNAWFAANVLSLKDGKVFVCYTEIQSDEGSGQLKEWVPLEVEGTETPKIRIAHPMTTMRFEGTRKRRRTAVTDFAWSSGDRVDVWVQDCWREGVVVETNKIDVTSLTVQFLAQGETLVVRSWHVRPTLIWKDDKWIKWSTLKGCHSSEGDTPHEKRRKFVSSFMEEGKEKDNSSKNINLVESGTHEESTVLPVSTQQSSSGVGEIYRDENNLKTRKTTKNVFQKEGSRVVFGVPKPGKKQKFKDVSNVADGNSKNNNTPNDSAKLASYLTARGSKNNSKIAETKSKAVKSRKPPVPLFRTKDKSKVCKPASRDALMVDSSVKDSVLGNRNRMEFGSSSNTGDSTDASTSKLSSRCSKRRKVVAGGGKETKAEVKVKEKSSSETGEPRRSNRRIQPTSRLLEGLQSSLTISKLPAVSHTSQRSHNKVTSKGNINHG